MTPRRSSSLAFSLSLSVYRESVYTHGCSARGGSVHEGREKLVRARESSEHVAYSAILLLCRLPFRPLRPAAVLLSPGFSRLHTRLLGESFLLFYLFFFFFISPRLFSVILDFSTFAACGRACKLPCAGLDLRALLA